MIWIALIAGAMFGWYVTFLWFTIRNAPVMDDPSWLEGERMTDRNRATYYLLPPKSVFDEPEFESEHKN